MDKPIKHENFNTPVAPEQGLAHLEEATYTPELIYLSTRNEDNMISWDEGKLLALGKLFEEEGGELILNLDSIAPNSEILGSDIRLIYKGILESLGGVDNSDAIILGPPPYEYINSENRYEDHKFISNIKEIMNSLDEEFGAHFFRQYNEQDL